MRIEKAMILAAGYGRRAQPLTLVRPKPLFPVLGRTLIDLLLDRLSAAGVKQAAVNTHHLAGRLEDHLAGRSDIGLTVFREEVLLGTAGGMKNAASALGPGPFFTANADVVGDIDLAALGGHHLRHAPAATLALVDDPRFNQVAVDEGGCVAGFRDDCPEDRPRLTFTGLSVVEPEVLERIPPGPADIIGVYRGLMAEGLTIRAFVARRPYWRDSGTLESYLGIVGDALASQRGEAVWTGPGAAIRPGAVVEGWAALEAGAVVEAGGRIKNAVLWPGAVVQPGGELIDAVAADRESVGGRVCGRAAASRAA